MLPITEADIFQKSRDFASRVSGTVFNYVSRGGQDNLSKITADHYISKLVETRAEQLLVQRGVVFTEGHGVDWDIYTRGKSFDEDLLGRFPGHNFLSRIHVKSCLQQTSRTPSWVFQYSKDRTDEIFDKSSYPQPQPSAKILQEPEMANVVVFGTCSPLTLEIGYQDTLSSAVAIHALLPVIQLFRLGLFQPPNKVQLQNQKRVVYWEDLSKMENRYEPTRTP